MKNGFIKVGAATPNIKVADCDYNAEQISALMKSAKDYGVKLLVFPELCITGYSCGDLFFQTKLLTSALSALDRLVSQSSSYEMITMVGIPLIKDCKLYNAAVAFAKGKILAIIPKTNIPNYAEFYEGRYFTPAPKETSTIQIGNNFYPFGSKILLQCNEFPAFCIGTEICEDLWVPTSPSNSLALAGATIIANLSVSDEIIGKAEYRRQLVKTQSAKLLCAYIYSDAGEGESTSDMVYSGHNIIAEYNQILAESKLFENGLIYSELDLGKLMHERRKTTTFVQNSTEKYDRIYFNMMNAETPLTRVFNPHPFVPSDETERNSRCDSILNMQSHGLKKRLQHTNADTAVLGISGGLDSSLALLVTARAFDLLGKPRSGIIAVTMPCFGTTLRTQNNAEFLSNALGVTLKTINISDAVNTHFRDIEHDPTEHDVVYENAQARERTQVLMDIANQNNGLVIGTGDLSELALGWATYNGDHMSMYGVNCSIPKTLVRHLIKYYADILTDTDLKHILYDILDTPVSPELLPPTNGVISQVTEDIIGPYELHDFFLYYMLRLGFSPAKIFKIACRTFSETYDQPTILKWLKVFYKRFFSQQFKRSCIPDGPKVGSVSLSPRGDLRMPSDASAAIWLNELETLLK